MKIAVIRKKLANYLQVADDEKIKAIYKFVEYEIKAIEKGPDDDLLKELRQRSKSFSDGSANTYTWEETKKAAIDSLKTKAAQ